MGNIGSCLYITDINKDNGDNEPILDNCNDGPNAPADKSKEDRIKEYCSSTSNYWISVDGAGNKGSGDYPYEGMDYVYDQRVWWCRYNVDAFAHETSMLPSAGLNTNANKNDIGV